MAKKLQNVPFKAFQTSPHVECGNTALAAMNLVFKSTCFKRECWGIIV